MPDPTPLTVARLWRYPVKSMGGEEVDELEFTGGGVRGDRVWSVRDVERNTTVSARRLPGMLLLRARFADAIGPGEPVLITLPDGDELHSDDPAIDARLSAALDRDVRLESLPDDRAGYRLPWRERLTAFTPGTIARDFGIAPGERLPDPSRMNLRELLTLARFATPPGSFVDLGEVHLVTDASLRAVGHGMNDGHPLDARRFRPNVLLATPGDELVEAGWTDATLWIGDRARVQVRMPTVRCVVPSRPQDGGVRLDKSVTRAVAGVAGRYLGVYADVSAAGDVRVGDEVRMDLPTPPSAVRRVAAFGRATAVRTVVRLADLTRR